MHESSSSGSNPEKQAIGPSAVKGAPYHIEVRPNEEAVVFRCEACSRELRDLRAVYLAYRAGAGWRIECSHHPDADHSTDAGHLFGGGLHSVDLLADLARTRWFQPAELFEAVTRLRAQSRGVYRQPGGGRG